MRTPPSPRFQKATRMSRFEDPVDHQLLDLRRDREPRPVPGDPVHAGGVRGRGAAGSSTRARRRSTSTRARRTACRRYEIEDFRAITEAILARGRRRDHQLLDRRDRRPDREADRLPARAAPRRRGAEHELDELREVLAAAQGLRLQGRVREQLRHDHRVHHGDERARDPARARVLRRRPCRQPRPAARHGPARRRRCRSRW